jgi:3-hydroxybutyryl-CoA dehydratase
MSGLSSSLRTFRYAQISVGDRQERDYVITPETYRNFLLAFADRSPVHVDEAFARSQGFEGCVMHGAILNGFVSHFVGMYFPGRFSLLLTVDLRYSNVSYLNDSIRVDALVSQKMDARRVIVLDLGITNLTRDWLAARGRAQVMIKEQD